MALSSLATSGSNSKRSLLMKGVKTLDTRHDCWEVMKCSICNSAFFPPSLIFDRCSFSYDFPKFVFSFLLWLLLGFFPSEGVLSNLLTDGFSFNFSVCSIWRSPNVAWALAASNSFCLCQLNLLVSFILLCPLHPVLWLEYRLFFQDTLEHPSSLWWICISFPNIDWIV